MRGDADATYVALKRLGGALVVALDAGDVVHGEREVNGQQPRHIYIYIYMYMYIYIYIYIYIYVTLRGWQSTVDIVLSETSNS